MAKRKAPEILRSVFKDGFIIKGTPKQIAERYEQFEKEYRAENNVIMAETAGQHAEHYRRLI